MSITQPWDIVPTSEFTLELIKYREDLDKSLEDADRSDIPLLKDISENFDVFVNKIYSVWEYKTAYYRYPIISGSITHRMWTAHYTSFYSRSVISLHGLTY